MKILEKAYGKINLGLDVLGLRADRYHEVALVMQSIELADEIEITYAPEFKVTTDRDDLPGDKDNLAYKAAVIMAKISGKPLNIHIHIKKKVFMAAGLAGGSADAAAVLRGLNIFWEMKLTREKLELIAARIGSDVPFCIAGGTVLATGRGEQLKVLPDMPPMCVLLAKPKISVSTAVAYRDFDREKNVEHPDIKKMIKKIQTADFAGALALCGNVLEPPALKKYPVIEEIKRIITEEGAETVMMTGSGPTVFAVVSNEEKAEEIAGKLKNLNLELAVTKMRGRMRML